MHAVLPEEVHATIERDASWPFGWSVEVWAGPKLSFSRWTYTRAGARRTARSGIKLERRRLTPKTDREAIR